MTAFGWVTSPDPRQYIGDMLNAVPVYGRQVPSSASQFTCFTSTKVQILTPEEVQILGEFPGEHHQALVESLKLLLRGLQEYVSNYHPHGLEWNARNAPAKAAGGDGDAPRDAAEQGAAAHKRKPLNFTSDREAKVDCGGMRTKRLCTLAKPLCTRAKALCTLTKHLCLYTR